MGTNLLVEINGEHVRLDKCDWVLWGPCDCPFGVALAVTGFATYATADDAWRAFYDYKREITKAVRDGYRLELVTHERWSREICDQMKAGCPHA